MPKKPKIDKKRAVKHFSAMLDDLSFFYHVTGDEPRSRSLKKAARKLRAKRRSTERGA